MRSSNDRINLDVSFFLAQLQHPLHTEIEHLRLTILGASEHLNENIKWNSPNYFLAENKDRITLRIYPPKQLQLIFHRGAKKQDPLNEKLITDSSGLLVWKENDRAILSFKKLEEIEQHHNALKEIIIRWIEATW